MAMSAKERVALHRYRKRNGIPTPPRTRKPPKPPAPPRVSKYRAARKAKTGRMLPEIQIALYPLSEQDARILSEIKELAEKRGYPNISALGRELLTEWWMKWR